MSVNHVLSDLSLNVLSDLTQSISSLMTGGYIQKNNIHLICCRRFWTWKIFKVKLLRHLHSPASLNASKCLDYCPIPEQCRLRFLLQTSGDGNVSTGDLVNLRSFNPMRTWCYAKKTGGQIYCGK